MEQHSIIFRVQREQAEALLKFLRAVARDDIKRALDSADEVKSFTRASEKLQVALRKIVEPDRP
jgi:hypothetical protein